MTALLMHVCHSRSMRRLKPAMSRFKIQVYSNASNAEGKSLDMKKIMPSFFVLLLLCYCSPPEPVSPAQETAPEIEGPSIEDEEAWLAELLSEREEKDQTFKTSRTSPMAGVQYLRSESEERVFLTREDRTFGLAAEPVANAVVSFEKKKDDWAVHYLSENVTGRNGEEEVPDGALLGKRISLSVEDFVVRGYPQEGRLVFIVFDPERGEWKDFAHLLYFPPDSSFALPARLVKLEENDEVKMLTSQNLEKIFFRYAIIEFNLDGQGQELTAFKYALEGKSSDILFIPFKDTTSGKATYGAGRFLEIHEPEEERFILDFNRCFNPLCNYSPAYNCPIPPRENRLKVAIEAGEKTYPTEHH